jgi:hypothetical protein
MNETMSAAALASLASGDLETARRWADEYVSGTQGCYLSASLTTRARVEIVQGEVEQAQRDLYEALAIAADTGTRAGVPNIMECLAELAATVESHREAARLFGAAETLRKRIGEVRFKIFDNLQSTQGVQAEIRKRQGILRLLYTKRLTDPHQPAMRARDFAEMLACPLEHLEFSLWFLKENKLITRSDNNHFEITWQGVTAFESEETTFGRKTLVQLPAPA